MSFSIVFASSATLYFVSNINHSYNTLLKNSEPSDAVLNLNNSNLNNDNLFKSQENNLIYDLNLDFFNHSNENKNGPNSLNSLLKPKNDKYFENLEEYRNFKKSFLYLPAKLSRSIFFYKNKINQGKTFLFSSFDGNINEKGEFLKQEQNNDSKEPQKNWISNQIDYDKKNKWYQHEKINDINSMFLLRQKSILYSYGTSEIPKNPIFWKNIALKINENGDPKKINFKVDPIKGITSQPNDLGLIDSTGFFEDGVLKSDIPFNQVFLKYPKNVKRFISSQKINLNDQTDKGIRMLQVDNLNENNEKTWIDTPFFITDYKNNSTNDPNFQDSKSWISDEKHDLAPFKNNYGEILNLVKNGTDIFNILPSIVKSYNVSIPLKNINWDIGILWPFYDYLKILHNPKFLTKSIVSNFVTNLENNKIKNNNKNTINKLNQNVNDYIFNIHIDESKLNSFQLQTLEYIKTKNEKDYDDLTRFIYSINSSWIKEELDKRILKSEKKENFLNINFDNYEDLKFKFKKSENEYISGLDILKEWIIKESTNHKTFFTKKIEEYQKDFLLNKLSKKNINFNFQKSFVITDSSSSQNVLVSLKDEIEENKIINPKINSLYITQGTKLNSSRKFNKVFDNLLKTDSTIKNVNLENDFIYPETNKRYLINLVRFFNHSSFSKTFQEDKRFELIKQLTIDIINDLKTGYINANKYFYLMSILTPNFYANSENLLKNNNQGLNVNLSINYGIGLPSYFDTAKLHSRYAYSAIVTEKWLNSHNKKVINFEEWEKTKNLNETEFLNWIENLDDSYKFSINFKKFVILGVGQSTENAYPLISREKQVVNTKTESLIFVNKLAYNAILSTSPEIIEDEHIFIKLQGKTKFGKRKNFNQINENLFKDNTKQKAFLLSNNKNNITVISRYLFPIRIKSIIRLVSSIFILILILIWIYLSILITKIYIEKNQTSLAIMKANGFSTFRTSLAISIIGSIIASISGFFGYLLTYFTQGFFLKILNNYWFIPIKTHLFSFFGFFGPGFIIYLFFLFFVFVTIFFLFKNPINNLISKNTDIPINRLLHVIKSRKIVLPIKTKFRSALFLNKIWKYILFIILSSFALSLLSMGISTPFKFNFSRKETIKNRKYFYNFDLVTPSEQSGLYKTQNTRFLGISDEKESAISNIYENQTVSGNKNQETPYTILWNTLPSEENKIANRNLFALRKLDGSIMYFGKDNKPKYFTNLLMPSYVGFRTITTNIDFFENGVFTKWLLDFDIKILSLNLNAWDTIKTSLNNEIINKVNLANNLFINKMLSIKEIKKANDIGSGSASSPRPFFEKISNNNYKLNSSNILTNIDVSNLNKIRFNNSFLKFIGMVYGEAYDIAQVKDTKMTYGIIPINENTETYTYLNSKITNKKIRLPLLFNTKKSKRLEDVEVKIYGVKLNSKLITIYNNKNEKINFKLESKINDSYPVIINNGAALKYNLKKNSFFDAVISNTYDRFTKKILDNDSSVKKIRFKVIDISSDSFGTAFYTSQNFANEILNLNFDQGALMFKSYFKEKITNEENEDLDKTKINLNVVGNSNSIYDTKISKINIENNLPKDYTPFNGVFSNEKDPVLLNNVVLQSNSGLWGNFSAFNTKDFSKIAETTSSYIIFNKIVPFEKSRVKNLKNYLQNKHPSFNWTDDDRNDIVEFLTKLFPLNNEKLWRDLDEIFGEKSVLLSVIDIEFFKELFSIFNTIFTTFSSIQNIVILIIIPIIVMVIMILSSVMISELKKILAVLKTLGYSNKNNLVSILSTFLPVIFVSLLVGILVMFMSTFAIQTIIFKATSIFLSKAINWLPYLYGTIAVIFIMILNFLNLWIYLKKQNFKNAI